MAATFDPPSSGGGGGSGPGDNEYYLTPEEKIKLGATELYTLPEKQKLAGIEAEATKNDTDENLRDRATHTGTQEASTIVDLPDVLSTKVDAVPGKVLTDANFTQDEKDKLAELEDAHLRGFHSSLQALEDANPTPRAGDYGAVDDGVTILWHSWNPATSTWDPRVGESTEILPAQVKQFYEANADTNAFTDDEKALLASFANRHGWSDKGTWNAATNTPALLDGTGTPGDFYVVTTPGERSFGSRIYNFELYDWIVFFRGTWQRFATNPKALTWDNVAGKPDFGAIYAAKPRGTIGHPIPAAYYRKSADQSLGNASQQTVAWQTAIYDQFGMKSGDDFIIPAWATHVRISASLLYGPSTGGYRYLTIQRGGAFVVSNRTLSTGATAQTEVGVITPILPVTGGDSFRVQTWQNSGGSLAVLGLAATWINIELFTTN